PTCLSPSPYNDALPIYLVTEAYYLDRNGKKQSVSIKGGTIQVPAKVFISPGRTNVYLVLSLSGLPAPGNYQLAAAEITDNGVIEDRKSTRLNSSHVSIS